MKLMTFGEALTDARSYNKKHLLLGNGFSIACRPDVFVYQKLYEQADFSRLSPSVPKVFSALGTQDFERVIKLLRDSVLLLSAYDGVSPSLISSLNNDAAGLRELLVQTIAASHPERPSDIASWEYEACRAFLEPFDKIYTFNYDLLLYWAQMYAIEGGASKPDDGFRNPEDAWDADYVTWEPGNSFHQDTWFLHGGLHLFDAGTEIQKYTWIKTGVRLIEQVRNALGRDLFPIFVAEGSSDEKYTHIRHNDYLAKAYRSFSEINGALFIYGHSLAENDGHYLRRIEHGKLSAIYVALYGDPESEDNREIRMRAMRLNALDRKKPLAVAFYDASSAKVWGK